MTDDLRDTIDLLVNAVTRQARARRAAVVANELVEALRDLTGTAIDSDSVTADHTAWLRADEVRRDLNRTADKATAEVRAVRRQLLDDAAAAVPVAAPAPSVAATLGKIGREIAQPGSQPVVIPRPLPRAARAIDTIGQETPS